MRAGQSERSLTYRHDPELGWAPIPGSTSIVTNARTIHAQHNRLGFRDIEFARPDVACPGRFQAVGTGCFAAASANFSTAFLNVAVAGDMGVRAVQEMRQRR